MSEFRCINGHLMLSCHGLHCPVCGGKVHTMDGLTNRQLRQMEEDLTEIDDFTEIWPEDEEYYQIEE